MRDTYLQVRSFMIGAHFFCYLKFYFIIKENIK